MLNLPVLFAQHPPKASIELRIQWWLGATINAAKHNTKRIQISTEENKSLMQPKLKYAVKVVFIFGAPEEHGAPEVLRK